MPVATVEAFVAAVRSSRLVSEDRLERAVRGCAPSGDPRDFATRLVERGDITRWQAQMLLSGRTAFYLGKYKLLNELGRGGMGAVFQAEQVPLGRIVALKVMAPQALKDKDAVARFQREIQAAAALTHPNIVAALDADCVNATHFLVMEYVDGESLDAVLKGEKRLPMPIACEYIRQAALGLQHAHERGMAHRDIKPANLLVTRSEDGPVVKILDFGLARFTSETRDEGGLTSTGQIMGTPDYIAPEQAKSTKQADIRSDIFSLGCTLFRALTGKLPFGGENVMEKLAARLTEDAPPLRSLVSDAPEALEQLLKRMLARNPVERPQTPKAVAEVLAPLATTKEKIAGGITRTSAGGATAEASDPLHPADVRPVAVDPLLNRFLGDLAHDAAGEERVETMTGGSAGPGTVNGETNRRTSTRHTAGSRKSLRISLLLGGMLGTALLGAWWWWNAGTTVIAVDWPEDQREGGAILVDGKAVRLPGKDELRFEGAPGKRSVQLTRPGYEDVRESWVLAKGEEKRLALSWIPTRATERRMAWDDVQRGIEARVESLAADGDIAAQVGDENVRTAKTRLMAFRAAWPGTAEALQAAALFAQLPSAVDTLRRSDIPQPVLRLFGTGFDDAPSQLAGVFGDGRLDNLTVFQTNNVQIDLSSDGKLAAGMNYPQGMVWMWETDRGELLWKSTEFGACRCLAFSPTQPGQLTIGTNEGNLWLCEARTREKRALSANEGLIEWLAYDADGKSVATVARGLPLRVTRIAGGKEPKEFSADEPYLRSVSFSRDGRMIASASGPHNQERTVNVWDLENGEKRHLLSGHKSAAGIIRFGPTSDTLVSMGEAETIVWDLSTGKPKAQFQGGFSMAFSPDFRFLACTHGNRVQLIETANWKVSEEFEAGPSWLRGGACFNRRDGSLALLGGDARIRFWNVETKREILPIEKLSGAATVSPDADWLATGAPDGRVMLFPLSTGGKPKELGRHPAAVLWTTFSPKAPWLATADGINRLRLWNVNSGEFTERDLGSVGDQPARVEFSTDGKLLATTNSHDLTVRLWSVVEGPQPELKLIRTLKQQNPNLRSAVFSPDGRFLAIGLEGLLRLWDIPAGKYAPPLPLSDTAGRIEDVAFSPNGSEIAAAFREGMFKVWNVATKKLRHRTLSDSQSLTGVAYSPDGRLLASADTDGLIRVWDAKSYDLREEIVLGPGGLSIGSVRFTPDGRHLVTGNSNGTMSVLRLAEWSPKSSSQD